MPRSNLAWLLFALAWTACASRTARGSGPVLLDSESDPDVLRAVRVLPAGAVTPTKIRDVKPASPGGYPRGSRQEVLLEGVVTAEGALRVVTLLKATDAAFARACVRAAKQWRYEPALAADGTPFALWTTVVCTVTTR